MPFLRRDVAQLGSALRSGRRGRWFESSHPDYYLWNNTLFVVFNTLVSLLNQKHNIDQKSTIYSHPATAKFLSDASTSLNKLD